MQQPNQLDMLLGCSDKSIWLRSQAYVGYTYVELSEHPAEQSFPLMRLIADATGLIAGWCTDALSSAMKSATAPLHCLLQLQ